MQTRTSSNDPVQPGLHILLSGFHNPQGNDICSSFLSIPSGSLSFINVLICLPVLSPHLDQFPPFSLFNFSEKLQNIFEIRLKKYGVTVQKSLLKKVFINK